MRNASFYKYLTAILGGAVISVNVASAQTAALYNELSGLDADGQAELLQNSQELGNGAVKTSYRLPAPNGNVVLKTCNESGDDCLNQMSAEIDDYNRLAADFQGDLVAYYPDQTGDLRSFVCADVDPEAPEKDCAFILESYLNGTWKHLSNDFGGLGNACIWQHDEDRDVFSQALNQAMNTAYNNGNYAALAGQVNGTSLGGISTSLMFTDYAFIDLQGAFTATGFIISDTGVEEADDDVENRNCQVNWICALAKRLYPDEDCEFVQQLN